MIFLEGSLRIADWGMRIAELRFVCHLIVCSLSSELHGARVIQFGETEFGVGSNHIADWGMRIAE